MPARALLAALAALLLLAGAANGDLLCLTNNERSKAGVAPLALSSFLNSAALVHCNDMARGGFMSHDGSDGSSPWDRFRAAGLSDFSTGGENVASGQTSEEEVMQAWMNSPGHRENILNPAFTIFGSARVGNYWTQDFAASSMDSGSSASCNGAPAPAPQPTAAPAPSSAPVSSDPSTSSGSPSTSDSGSGSGGGSGYWQPSSGGSGYWQPSSGGSGWQHSDGTGSGYQPVTTTTTIATRPTWGWWDWWRRPTTAASEPTPTTEAQPTMQPQQPSESVQPTPDSQPKVQPQPQPTQASDPAPIAQPTQDIQPSQPTSAPSSNSNSESDQPTYYSPSSSDNGNGNGNGNSWRNTGTSPANPSSNGASHANPNSAAAQSANAQSVQQSSSNPLESIEVNVDSYSSSPAGSFTYGSKTGNCNKICRGVKCSVVCEFN